MHSRRQRSARRACAGMTLFEATLVMSLLGVLMLSFAVSANAFVDRAEARHLEQQAFSTADQWLSEMEGAIRAAEQIERAGDGILQISSRYFFDMDDQLETVRYTLVGTDLRRELALSGSSYAPAEIILQGVQRFAPLSAVIQDEFSREDYDRLLPVGELLPIDTAEETNYKVLDFGNVDADLDASYVADYERLDVAATSGWKSVTVSPPLARDGLRANVSFYPQENGNEYRPLVYGDESPDTNNVSVMFADNQDVYLRKAEGGTVTNSASTTTWSEDENYRVRLSFRGDGATGYIDRGEGWEPIGTLSAGALDNKKLHLQVTSSDAVGGFDDVAVHYPFVQIELDLRIGAETERIVAGAYCRNVQ